MKMQFDRIPVAYLQKLTDGMRTQEETLEVRLPEVMPDIGRVLGAWGQVIIRGKEWNSDSMSVSCGVMAWILYMPEDEDGVRSVEAWLPFSMKWDLPETRHDGKIVVSCMLKGVDARSTSARKMMVRAVLCADAQAWQTEQAQIAVPTELPEDVQLQMSTYPVMLPREAGEKPFMLEEEMTISNGPKPEKLLYYTMQPEITEQKVMADKIVFRGNAAVHLLYRGEDGGLHSWDYDLPFSQYADLDGSYESDGTVSVQPSVTSLDITLGEDGQIQLKAGLLGQYLVWDRTMVTIPEDAYSPYRKLELTLELLQLPAVLDQLTNSLQAEKTLQTEARQIADLAFYPGCGQRVHRDDGTQIALPGQFQMLYYDENGDLRGAMIPWEESWDLQAEKNSIADVRWISVGKPQAAMGADTVTVRADMELQATISAGQGMQMLVGMELGEMEKPNPNRPSLILCKKGNRSLWDVAKETGSTVDDIWKTNALEAEPDHDRILLIPVK